MLRSRFPSIVRNLDNEVDPAILATAEAIAQGAKDRVPVETGALRDAIHVARHGEGNYSVIAGDDDAFYGHIIEHGGVNTPPHPFLVPAAEAERDNINTRGRTALRDL